MRRLSFILSSLTLLSAVFLTYNLYRDYRFENSPISKEIESKISQKEREVIALIKKYYRVDFNVPILIEDIESNLYGVTIYNSRSIRIVLNKKRIKESLNYMLDDVIAHEYAHALMFYFGKFDGHSKEWQDICFKLGGSRCDRYVNHKDVIFEKIKPF